MVSYEGEFAQRVIFAVNKDHHTMDRQVTSHITGKINIDVPCCRMLGP